MRADSIKVDTQDKHLLHPINQRAARIHQDTQDKLQPRLIKQQAISPHKAQAPTTIPNSHPMPKTHKVVHNKGRRRITAHSSHHTLQIHKAAPIQAQINITTNSKHSSNRCTVTHNSNHRMEPGSSRTHTPPRYTLDPHLVIYNNRNITCFKASTMLHIKAAYTAMEERHNFQWEAIQARAKDTHLLHQVKEVPVRCRGMGEGDGR